MEKSATYVPLTLWTNIDKEIVMKYNHKQTSRNSLFEGSMTVSSDEEKLSLSERKLRLEHNKTLIANKLTVTNLAKYNANDWLIINRDGKGKLLESMECYTYTEFINDVMSLKCWTTHWRGKSSARAGDSVAAEHRQTDTHRLIYISNTEDYDIYTWMIKQ